MQCLVVTAHPLTDSLCAEMTRRAMRALDAAGHDVILEDLYASGFDAVMDRAERASYYAERYDTERVAGEVDRLLAADAMVLLFPTWWFGPPAVLKGWFDRVWAPGVAYDHAKGYGPIKPRLHRLREMLVVTSLGASAWVDRLVLRQPVRRVIKTAIIGACAPKCRFQMVSQYQSESLTPARVEAFWRRIDRALARWPVRGTSR